MIAKTEIIVEKQGQFYIWYLETRSSNIRIDINHAVMLQGSYTSLDDAVYGSDADYVFFKDESGKLFEVCFDMYGQIMLEEVK